MTNQDLLAHSRVICTHFDSYSAALLFPRWDKTLLWPNALPESATVMPPPTTISPEHVANTVK
ncbi:hypothetical protein [Rhodoferax sp.]|uniref:hypothetical protein n=1 Tax=Rhodoferax sp. TaxID=50421 RepID=UPI0026249B88|nr:hypothetical protein [Rhodoferax sp.]